MNGGGTSGIIINIYNGQHTDPEEPPTRLARAHAGRAARPTPAAPTVKDRPLDDVIVPSLPPDWQPPAFLTEGVPTSESEASEEEEVKDALIM